MRAAVAIVVLAGLVALVPASAQASLRWGEPTDFSDGFPGTVAIDARGDVLALWHRGHSSQDIRTFYAWRPPRGDWTTPREIRAAAGTQGVKVSLSPLGRAVAAWNDGDGRVLAAEAPTGGAFEKAEVVATGIDNFTEVDLASDDAGNALVAWLIDTHSGRQNSGATIFASSRSAGGAWSKPRDLSGDVAGGGPYVAMNAAGAATVGWSTVVGGFAEITYRQPAGSFGPPERAPTGGFAIPLRLVVDDGGQVFLAVPTGAFSNQPARTVLATRSPVGDWSAPFEFETGGAPAAMLVEPDGDVNMLMDNYVDGKQKVQLATRRADGEVIGPVTVAEDRTGSAAAMNQHGDILAAWDHWYSSQQFGRIEVADKPAVSPLFEPALPISPDNSIEPGVALNDAGQAALIWATGGYGQPRAQVIVREDPKLPVLPFPPVPTIDVPALPELDPDGDLVLRVRCSRACKASPRGVLVPGGAAKPTRASGKTRRLEAGRRGSLTVDFGSAGAKAVRAAIEQGRKPLVHVSVRARGRSPRPLTVSRRVRLR